VVEIADTCLGSHSYEILSTRAMTKFSNHIRSNSAGITLVSHASQKLN
jgi:hypothetical protein